MDYKMEARSRAKLKHLDFNALSLSVELMQTSYADCAGG